MPKFIAEKWPIVLPQEDGTVWHKQLAFLHMWEQLCEEIATPRTSLRDNLVARLQSFVKLHPNEALTESVRKPVGSVDQMWDRYDAYIYTAGATALCIRQISSDVSLRNACKVIGK